MVPDICANKVFRLSTSEKVIEILTYNRDIIDSNSTTLKQAFN